MVENTQQSRFVTRDSFQELQSYNSFQNVGENSSGHCLTHMSTQPTIKNSQEHLVRCLSIGFASQSEPNLTLSIPYLRRERDSQLRWDWAAKSQEFQS